MVRQFCKAYPRLDRQDVKFRAIELALAAEKTFKPELGYSFATYLGGFSSNGRLRELHRLHDQLVAAEGVKIYRTKDDLAFEEAEEAGEPTEPVNFAGGGNGARLLFDLQWWEARISDIVRHVAHGPIHRIVPWPKLPQWGKNSLTGGEPQLLMARCLPLRSVIGSGLALSCGPVTMPEPYTSASRKICAGRQTTARGAVALGLDYGGC